MILESNLTQALQAIGADIKRLTTRDVTVRQRPNGSWPTLAAAAPLW